ncbi:uncharacterized protein LOC126668287 [Mercurialis annua]|uniref:uncharacterized protein LOC126668287 n=1 Tax=Mercurialis annua TaxID=3986 RepID=UPI00215F0F26|nr:uncharacterized protein LOC126668287 [Mercurialis annua]
MLDFSAFVSNSALIEHTLQGRFFTWQNSFARSKLDRCFMSSPAFTAWPSGILKALPKLPNANLVIKLRELRSALKAWNKDIFGDLNAKLATIQKDISALEAETDFSSLSEQDGITLAGLNAEFDQLSKHLESLWHQKSRLNWNINGDRNTKFFHTVASIHSKSNSISDICIDGVSYSSPADIKQRVQSYYKDLFQRDSSVNYLLDDLPIRSLSAIQAASLSACFTEEEILATLLSCDSNKAPTLLF